MNFRETSANQALRERIKDDEAAILQFLRTLERSLEISKPHLAEILQLEASNALEECRRAVRRLANLGIVVHTREIEQQRAIDRVGLVVHAGEIKPRPPIARVDQSWGDGIRVLWIDDNIMMPHEDKAGDWREAHGVDLLFAFSLEEANVLLEGNVDCIICDLHLSGSEERSKAGGETALDLIPMLKRRGLAIPIIIASGHVASPWRERIPGYPEIVSVVEIGSGRFDKAFDKFQVDIEQAMLAAISDRLEKA